MYAPTPTVAVFAPSPLVTVTIEPGDPDPEIHFHAGGQGVWVARLAGALGAQVLLATTFGGETGRVLSAVLRAPGVEVHDVAIASPNGAYIHDRRSGRRRAIVEVRRRGFGVMRSTTSTGSRSPTPWQPASPASQGLSTLAPSTRMSTAGWRATCAEMASPSFSPISPARHCKPPCRAASTY